MENEGPCDCGDIGFWQMNPFVFEIYGEEQFEFICQSCHYTMLGDI